jgi:hypothetical protein
MIGGLSVAQQRVLASSNVGDLLWPLKFFYQVRRTFEQQRVKEHAQA